MTGEKQLRIDAGVLLGCYGSRYELRELAEKYVTRKRRVRVNDACVLLDFRLAAGQLPSRLIAQRIAQIMGPCMHVDMHATRAAVLVIAQRSMDLICNALQCDAWMVKLVVPTTIAFGLPTRRFGAPPAYGYGAPPPAYGAAPTYGFGAPVGASRPNRNIRRHRLLISRLFCPHGLGSLQVAATAAADSVEVDLVAAAAAVDLGAVDSAEPAEAVTGWEPLAQDFRRSDGTWGSSPHLRRTFITSTPPLPRARQPRYVAA